MNIVWTIVGTLLLFSFIVLLHELGHFLTARMFGVKVNEFAVGMGPKIIKWGKGETLYSIRAFPIGGFCAMEGEDETSNDPRAFGNKKPWKRLIVLIAGAFMNFLLGFVILIALSAQEDSFKTTTIASTGDAIVISGQNTIEENDTITAINGYKVYSDMDFSFAISRYADEEMIFTVNRDGKKVDIDGVTIDITKLTGKDNGYAFFVKSVDKNLLTVISESAKNTVSVVRVVWGSLIDLVKGEYKITDLSGPVGTAEVVGQAATSGKNFVENLNNVLYIMALISINLGVVNLLPLPALDGGRCIFVLIEWVRGKPVPAKYEGVIHLIGFVLLLGLMVVVMFSDIFKLFS